MKYAMFDMPSRVVMQWQDTEVWEYPEPLPPFSRVALPEEFELPATTAGWWVVDGLATQVQPPPLPPSEEQVMTDLTARLAAAIPKVIPLMCAGALSEETPAEAATRVEWQTYVMLLGRVPEQETFPGAVVWPALPA